jgi:hypothetical protein
MVLKHYSIGVAVGASEGLVVPVLRDADRLSFAQIEEKVRAFAKAAEDGTLSLADIQGGTFTITNGGVFGSLFSTPILNPPQVGILGLHAIKDRPAAVNGQVLIRPMMYTALTYDHRIVDGAEAVRFLVRVKQLVEDPGALLLNSMIGNADMKVRQSGGRLRRLFAVTLLLVAGCGKSPSSPSEPPASPPPASITFADFSGLWTVQYRVTTCDINHNCSSLRGSQQALDFAYPVSNPSLGGGIESDLVRVVKFVR